jgi:7-keto-8-aminopelargonate synthetase-like enzyme
LPSPHALAFVADRLNETGDTVLGDALDNALLKDGIRASQVSHMLFTFSGNDPLKLLKSNLQSYAGTVPQLYVGLRVEGHQDFIKAVFALIGKAGS